MICLAKIEMKKVCPKEVANIIAAPAKSQRELVRMKVNVFIRDQDRILCFRSREKHQGDAENGMS